MAGVDSLAASRNLLNQLIEGRLEDKRVSALLKQNLNLLARKTVERTGRSGEHYIAHSRKEYWQMWLAAVGGGLLTVLTAAFKMRIVEQHFPLFVEGFLTGTNYAISFVLLQVFGLVLATKQPSATAATFAGIVRTNPGNASWSKIADFTARITRTQLAAAIGNVIAVCIGCVALERLWRVMFAQHYLPDESARHVYEALHPFASGTIIYAAGTGVILWLAALIGGWCENFAVFHRLTEAVSQHPFGRRIGQNKMASAAAWIELNLAGWSTSIALGYLLGFVPVIARFFGIPFDVRHVTLSTGTLALAAARFGTSSFGQGLVLLRHGRHRGDVCSQPRGQLRHFSVCRLARLRCPRPRTAAAGPVSAAPDGALSAEIPCADRAGQRRVAGAHCCAGRKMNYFFRAWLFGRSGHKAQRL